MDYYSTLHALALSDKDLIAKDPFKVHRPAFAEEFPVINPATGKIICNLPDLDETSCLDAVKTAVEITPTLKALSSKSKRNILLKWQDLMLNAIEDLAIIITSENGKPLAEARAEVSYAADFLGWFAGEAARIEGSVVQPSDRSNRVITIKQPVGTVAIITPWNFPAAMITRKVGAAFAAGCATIVKPATETPLTALALAELGRRAGVPNGALSIITTSKHLIEVGKMLTQHPDIRKLSFTGSSAVGKFLAAQCAPTVKRLSLELGGNAPFIVFNDANLEMAANAIIASKFRHSGQTCICTNRLYVQSGIYKKMSEVLVERVKCFHLGNGMDPETTHGPVINIAAVERISKLVEDAVNNGARILVGGGPARNLGAAFFEPTVLVDVSPQALCTREEIFGPLLALISFETEEDVVKLANNTRAGLAGYIATTDLAKAWRVAETLELGMVGINTGSISDVVSPFGGIKESGQGREGSSIGIDEYLEVKSITFAIGE